MQGAQSAAALSSKVRELDASQSRLQETLKRVESVLDLKTTIDFVTKAIGANDFESAARATFRVLRQDAPSAIQNDVSYELLRQLETQLRESIQQSCDQCMASQSYTTVLQLSCLYPLVGAPFQGLVRYCEVQRVILEQALAKKSVTLESQVSYTSTTTAID
jgi:conserved oligomeric Golgi complex subunit 4